MKRTGLLIAIVLTVALVALGSSAPVAVAASGQPRAAANGCPLYISCMDIIGVGCSCTGFVCNDKFICGTPVHVPPLG